MKFKTSFVNTNDKFFPGQLLQTGTEIHKPLLEIHKMAWDQEGAAGQLATADLLSKAGWRRRRTRDGPLAKTWLHLWVAVLDCLILDPPKAVILTENFN